LRGKQASSLEEVLLEEFRYLERRKQEQGNLFLLLK